MKILYEDNDIIVCYKEAGIPVQSARLGTQDMVSMLNNYLADTRDRSGYEENGVKDVENSSEKTKYRGKPSEKVKKSERYSERTAMPEIYVVHRLDQPVEGVLVFAKTENEVKKNEDDETGRREWKKQRNYMLTEIDLKTGRHHQIRVQMAHHKMPLYGDRKYNAQWETYLLRRQNEERDPFMKKSADQLALCAVRLSFRHPVSGKVMTFETKPQGAVFQIFVNQ